MRHGHRRPAAVSSLRRSAGRSGVRLHPYRDDRVALVGARLDDPRAPPSQPVPDSADRARRRRDDLRGGDASPSRRPPRSWCRRPPRTASASMPRGHRRLGGELHRGRGARRSATGAAKRWRGCKALAAEPVVPLGEAERRTAVQLCRGSARGALPGARGIPARDARPARADRDRGGAARGEPRAHRRDRRSSRPTPPSRRCARWSRSISGRSGCSPSTPTSLR